MEEQIFWPYDIERIKQNKGGNDNITQKQVDYIKSLSIDNEDIFQDIFDSIHDKKDNDLNNLLKGHGMYIIKCLKKEIKPVKKSVLLMNTKFNKFFKEIV